MATKIGPTFSEELTAAGVVDRRFTWNPMTGHIDFHPEVTDEERKKVLAVLAAHDGPLSEARHQAIEAARAEAAKRIAEPFGRPPDTLQLAWAEINAQNKGFRILKKLIEGTALPEERIDADVLDDLYRRNEAIRQAEDDSKAALLGAKSVEEVQVVKVGWPKE